MRQYINITETLKRYERALKSISKASDQANAIHLKTVAQTALDFEPTTADEFNDVEEQADIAKYDKQLSEEAESTWRGTILSKNYKSPFQEEE